MIIQSLYDFYNILLNDPNIEIAKTGYSEAKVKFVATLSKEGELLDIIQLQEGKKDWLDIMVPEQRKRQGIKPPPYFMCDNSKYVFGWSFDSKKTELTQNNFLAFQELNEKILHKVNNPKSMGIRNYLKRWRPEDALNHPIIKSKLDMLTKSKGGNIIFKLDFETGYIHHDSEILQAWNQHTNMSLGNEMIYQCLVTGKMEAIENTHPNIKGVKDANTTGATLVGVNAKAFESYGKTQALNSPVGKSIAFAYTTVLNYMLNNRKHRLQMGNATTVFWANDTSGECESLLYELIAPVEQKKDNEEKFDPKTTEFVKNGLQRLKEGKTITEKADVDFYILGLSPNNARLSVRFWYKDHFGELLQKVWQHHEDMKIIKSDGKSEVIPLSRILYETIPRNALKKESAPLLSGALMTSIFTGKPYPKGLFYAMISRIRADRDMNDIRVGVIKAYLKRNARIQRDEIKEEMITMALNEESVNVPYRIGRLFAVLEKAQEDAADGKLNSTIKDRYFGTASASPRAVFPVLIKLAQHHITKAKAKSKYGYVNDRRIQDILQGITDFPAHLNAEEQGLFILGYYHQREAFYQKNNSENKGEER